MYFQNFFTSSNSEEINQMLNLVIEVVRHEAVTELTFDYLKVVATNNEDKFLLQTMLDDEREHFEQLKRIYFYMTGQSAAGEPPTFEVPETYLLGIEEIFFNKVKVLNIYKRMKRISPTFDIREQISDFINDELSHLSMLNHILIKNKINERMHDYSTIHLEKQRFYM